MIKNKKYIYFVLPVFAREPCGGYKMVYEYANRLVDDGFDVSVLYLNDNIFRHYNIPKFIKYPIANYLTKKGPGWFPLDHRISCYSITSAKDLSKIPEPNFVVASAVVTVDFVFNNFVGAKKFYFIQDYEDWNNSKSYVNKTYGMGMTNIVVSNWLKNIVDKYSQSSSILIKNPVDTHQYKAKVPIEERNKYAIGMLWHKAPHKGCKLAIEAVKKVRQKYPDITLDMFGVTEPEFELPDWITFHLNASQEETIEIYNQSSIFVCATIEEGFGLTGLESMCCGDAFVSTDYTGVHEYAVNGENSLLSPVKDIDGLVDNIKRVIEDDNLRYTLSKNAIKSAEQFSWEEAYSKFKNLFV